MFYVQNPFNVIVPLCKCVANVVLWVCFVFYSLFVKIYGLTLKPEAEIKL